MEELKSKKTRAAVIALATALVLALGGTMAWLVSADGTVTNEFDPNRVKVEITETGTDDNGVNDSFDIIPGTEQAKDPKISATADCPAYVYAIVKDNTHDLVDYEIAEGWTEATGLTKVVTGKDKDGNEISIDPTAEGVKVYYREVSGTDEVFEHGPWSVLKDDKVSYSADLTNEDMYNADGTTSKYDDISLVFSAYAVQKTPFNDPAKAWNQEMPTVAVTGVTVTPETLSMKVGDADQQLTATVAPENATNKNVTWTSSDETVATVDADGKVHAVAAGTATITATTEDGSKTDTCEVTVEPASLGHIKWQVQLHSADDYTATFWPAMTNVYGKQPHDGDCICDCTWEEIVDGTHDFSNCHCTKTVTIDETKNTEIFNTLSSDVTSGMLFSSLTSDARRWSTGGDNRYPTYDMTLEAMQNAWDITGVTVSNFDLLSLDDAESVPQSSRIVYSESGDAYDCWWLNTPYEDRTDGAFGVCSDGSISAFGIDLDHRSGIAPSFSISN